MTGERPDDEEEPDRPVEFVQSLERGFSVIKAFGPGHAQMNLSEIAAASGLSRAAARRFLITLIELGYVRTDRKLYALRPKVLELGYSFLSSLTLTEIAPPHMEAVVAKVHQTCSISVLDEGDITYIARVLTRRIMAVAVSIGTRFPAYATAMGRVLLAFQPAEWLDTYLDKTDFHSFTARTVIQPDELREILDEVRADGYAILDQELEPGLRSIAVPIRDAGGTVIASMNVSTPTSQVGLDQLKAEVLPELHAAVERIEEGLRAAH
ncbi:MAG TPA: IclR family transcriptional regulator C-terminal domain-containing protein [Pseudonocardiaceae bacterium]|nr:IclR family transcriptional regulator C-terminal domain-containing protein [Pseudonocardiaceae bacterium]